MARSDAASHEHSHSHPGHVGRGASAPVEGVAEVALRDAYDASDLASLEDCLARLDGVSSVHVDRTRLVAHVAYDPSHTSAAEIERAAERVGYGCECRPRDATLAQPGHPSAGPVDAPSHAHHREAAHKAAADYGSHGATGAHDEHAGHGAEMVADLLRRFLVSLVLTLPPSSRTSARSSACTSSRLSASRRGCSASCSPRRSYGGADGRSSRRRGARYARARST